MADWSGQDYSRVSALQRSVAAESLAELVVDGSEWILDIGCGDGFLTAEIAARLPHGYIVGVDASPRMVATAGRRGPATPVGPVYVCADARRLPFGRSFDMVVSFNALHWVPQLGEALAGVAAVLRPRGRALIQMVCAGTRPSIESTAMQVAGHPRWASRFAGFSTPFIHPQPAELRELADSCGFQVASMTVLDREWDFGTVEQFTAWCAVGSTAWTERLPESDRAAFVDDLVAAYEPVVGQAGLVRFMQVRAELHL
ncbi:class I SAM-dependent methyltransferase [Mycolicibacterium psychrotolerans]|uniref:class I SAM-dependent methyltransferase n=1 Tax=Mycolicibacterium psychrotolerans TaxID=216929 RepID=UPI003D66782D